MNGRVTINQRKATCIHGECKMKIFTALSIIIIAISFVNANAGDPSAEELLIFMEDIMSPKASEALMQQVIETSSGGTREFVYHSYYDDFGEKSLMRYISPSRVKDEAFLMLNNADDIWAYFARTRRIRKLASHARKKKIMGSDFTYEDMVGGKRYRKEYLPQRLPDKKYRDQNCLILKLTPRPEEKTAYQKLVCYLRPTDYFPLKIDYFEKKDELLKILYMEDIRDIEGHPTAMRMVMHNQQDGSKTIMMVKQITYKVNFDDSFFSERNLKP